MIDGARFGTAVHFATSTVTVLNLGFAYGSILLFGTPCGNIILNLPNSSAAVSAIKALLIVVMIMTYTLFLIPVADLFEPVWPHRKSFPRLVVLRTGLVLLTGGVGIAAGAKFQLVTNLVGGVCNVMVGIILPPLIHLNLSHKKAARDRARGIYARGRTPSAATIVVDVGIAVFGFCVMCLTIFATIYSNVAPAATAGGGAARGSGGNHTNSSAQCAAV